MKLFGALLMVGALLAACSTLFAQIVEGTVVNSVTGAPIGGASVQIENAGKTPYQTTSDAQGAFRIEAVADGSYTALAFKGGFLTVQDQAALKPFKVVAGLDPVQLKLSLIPRGRISGRVFDADNHPVAGADISLFQRNGAGQTVASDANGGFSFEPAPGSYFLSARAPIKLSPPPAVGEQHYAWAKTWFPDVTQASEAEKIPIRPGAELVGQDVKLRAVNAYSIRGQILDSNGDPASNITVTLNRPDDSAQPLARTTISGKDGSFEFANVYDGDWRVSAESTGNAMLRAVAGITIASRDAEGAELRLTPPFSVPVEYVLETQDSKTKIQGSVVLRAEWGGGRDVPVPASRRDKDGNYKIEGIYPGRYLVTSLPLAGVAYYLASITLGDQDVLGQMVEFSSGSVPLRVVYRSDGGAVRGTVKECGNATIALAPQDPVCNVVWLLVVRAV